MLRYNVEQINDIRVISLEGQASVTERDVLQSLLEKEREIEDIYYILDLSHIFYIDSYGIGFLQNLIVTSKNRKNLIIVSDRDYIDYVIRFNKIDQMMNVKYLPTIEEALAKFKEMR